MIVVKNSSEHNILTILRIAPIIAIPLVVIIVIFTLYTNNQNRYLKEIEALKKDFIKSEKKIIQNEVLKTRELFQIKRDSSRARLKKKIRSKVYEAHTIANTIYNNNKDKMSTKEIQHLIADALINVRFFEGRGYYFINNNNGTAVLHRGINKLDLELDISSWKDIKGNSNVQDQIDRIRSKGEGFNTKFHKKLDTEEIKYIKEYEKISFVKNFEPYDWHIGTGDYVYNEQKIIQEEILAEMTAVSKLEVKTSKKNDYTTIMHARGDVLYHSDSNNININADDFKDTNGRSVGKEILNIRDASYIKYFYKSSTTGKILEKIGYFVYIPEWEWIVGSDFSIDKMKGVIDKEANKLEKLNESNLFYIGLFGLIVFLVSIFISIFISKTIKNIFNLYQEKITDQVSELQSLNATLLTSNDDLSKALKEQKELQKQKNEQQKILFQQSKMASMGDMIGNIAHQWRQPISTINMDANNMLLDIALEKFDITESEKYANSIVEQTKHLSRTIDDFRSFFIPDKEASTFILKSTISKTMSLLNESLKIHNIEVIENIEDIEVKALENELTQAILNIIKNAKDVLVTLSEERRRLIFINIYKKDNSVIINIKDSGGGVDKSIINKLFEPYFTTKHKSQGTGIGLYMTESIITKHLGGEMFVLNEEYEYEGENYKGALFSIILPLNKTSI